MGRHELSRRAEVAAPLVVDGTVLRDVWTGPNRSGMRLRGGPVTDPVEIADIAASVEHYGRPWWRRTGSRP